MIRDTCLDCFAVTCLLRQTLAMTYVPVCQKTQNLMNPLSTLTRDKNKLDIESPDRWQGIINTLKLRQNWHLFADNIFKFISLYENGCILIQILLKFIPKSAVKNRRSDNGLEQTKVTSHLWSNDALIYLRTVYMHHLARVIWLQTFQ